MNNFIKYNNFETLKNYKINFNCFNYKDYNSKKKEYELHKNNDNDNDNDNNNDKQIELKNLAYIDITANQYPINIQTPDMLCLFGFNKETNQICLQFTNYKTDQRMNLFYNFIQNLEYLQMKYIGLNEDNCNLYNSQIKQDSNMKYDPYLIIKIPFRNNKYEVDIRNKGNNNYCSITNLYNFTKVRCDIYIDKIWKYNERYICKWKLSRLLIL